MDDNFSDKVAFGVMCQLVIGSSATSMYLCIKRIGKKISSIKMQTNKNETKYTLHCSFRYLLQVHYITSC